MMYLPEFKYSVGLKDTGDNKIKLVASALKAYGKVRDKAGSDAANVDALRNLSKACAWWLFDKQKKIAEKSSDRTTNRAQVIRGLLKDALTDLGKLSPEEGQYAAQKCAAIGAGMVVADVKRSLKTVTGVSFSAKKDTTRALAPGYALERQDYVTKGKAAPPIAASHVEYALHNDAAVKGKFSKKDWDTISHSDYTAIARMLGPGDHHTGYLNRSDRVTCLVSFDNGVLTYASKTAAKSLADLMVYTGTGLKYGVMYAMDRYGNLYAEDETSGKARQKTDKFNHSSFCSGTSVICAGVLAVDKKGVLVHIDNVSGHYKPSLQDLIRALAVLKGAGIDLTNVRVRDFVPDKNYIASSLVAGAPAAWPPAMDAKLGLSQYISA